MLRIIASETAFIIMLSAQVRCIDISDKYCNKVTSTTFSMNRSGLSVK